MAERKKSINSERKLKTKVEYFPDIDVKHAHFANFHSNNKDVVISFLQLIPPISDGSSFDNELRCVSRLMLSIEDFTDFADTINFFREKNKEIFLKSEITDETSKTKK